MKQRHDLNHVINLGSIYFYLLQKALWIAFFPIKKILDFFNEWDILKNSETRDISQK